MIFEAIKQFVTEFANAAGWVMVIILAGILFMFIVNVLSRWWDKVMYVCTNLRRKWLRWIKK